MKTETRALSRLEQPGTFSIGCNYWASHAGTDMWRDWRADVVRQDLAKLSAAGVEVMRVFPLWPDFQPISTLYGFGASSVEVRNGEEPLASDGPGHAGVSVVMLQRFIEFCTLAREAKIDLIVGVVTGWMSGRLFVPPALAGRDPITDPVSIAWQIKLVRTIVRHAANEAAIVAWDLGNECNCMGRATSRESAYVWTASIANAIKSADPSRPIVSGMHSLTTSVGSVDGAAQKWTIEDQAELTDILTTHPYPYWSRHTRADRVDSLRTTLHATAETRFYADIGKTTAFAEEIGTMGPMVASDDASADFARVNLFSLWANDCRGFLWWCAHDQLNLSHAPYDWTAVELELGLLRVDGTAKPVLNEMGQFKALLKSLPFGTLPRAAREAVCILTHTQDDWAAAYGAFVLAKQAHLELDFVHIQQNIPDAPIYLLPSLTGATPLPRRKWVELVERVKQGATLYISLNDGILSQFNEVAGVEVVGRSIATAPVTVKLSGDENVSLGVPLGEQMFVKNRTATILGTRTDDGSPAFWRNKFGKGEVIVFAAPLEIRLSQRPSVFDVGAPAYWKVYEQIAAGRPSGRLLKTRNPRVAVTEHALSTGERLVIVINHGAEKQAVEFETIAGLSLGRTHYGKAPLLVAQKLVVSVPRFDACAFTLTGHG